MRASVVVSTVAHTVLIGWGLISLPRAFDDSAPIETLPVELVTLAELTDLASGSRTAEPEPPAPEASSEPEPSTPPPPPPAPPPPPPEPEPVQAAEAAAPPPTLTPVQPAPEPVAPPVPEPAPAPPARVAAAEPAPTIPSDPVPLPRARPRPPSPQTTASIPTPPTPTPPTPTPTPAPPTLTPPSPSPSSPFNASDIAALIDRSPPSSPSQPTPAETPGLGVADGRFDAAMTQNELAALRERIMSCWSMPQGALNAAELRTEVHIRLNADGSLNGQPEISSRPFGRYTTIGPESVVRAVIACAPYNLPAEKYAQWQEIILDFNPTDMFGGG